MLDSWRRKRIIDKFVKVLPIQLAHRYGNRDYYTHGQLMTTLADEGYAEKYRGYAIALCLERADAVELLGNEAMVDQLRTELAEKYFHGDMGFTARSNGYRRAGGAEHFSAGYYLPGAGESGGAGAVSGD